MSASPSSRRSFLKSTGLGVAAVTLGLRPAPAQRASRPNILFIMTDDHATHAISCYGSRINATPNIDRLAKQGVRFDQAFCTNSICAPSRAVLLTGKYGHLNGQRDNLTTFDGNQQTFPKLLQNAGYTTALFGKWHLKSDPTGFDYWNILPGQGMYYDPDFIEMGVRSRREGYATDLITDYCLNWLKSQDKQKPFAVLLHHKAPHRNWMPNVKHLSMYADKDIPLPETFWDDYSTRSDAARTQEMRIADHMRWVSDLKLTPKANPDDDTPEEKKEREDWNSMTMRLNAEEKKAWLEAYGPGSDDLRSRGLKEFEDKRIQSLKDLKPLNGPGKDPQGASSIEDKDKANQVAGWKYQRYIKDYLRCVASVDENIGRVLDYLDESGLAENTVVVYTSDQGMYLGDHGWFDKRFMYEESFRMPLIIRYPREVEPGASESMVMNLDFAPTFLDFAGAQVPADMQGVSLRSPLKGLSPASWRTSVYYHYYEYPAEHAVKRHYGVRTNRYKLVHFYNDIDAWELYDLQKDPRELRNLYEDPAYKGIVAELKTELARLRAQYRDESE